MVSKPELILISVSGAVATGKSTLLDALHADLVQNAPGCAVAKTPSFSSQLFARWKARKLPTAPFPVENYDAIDQRGHREWFQRQLPDSLAFELETALQALDKRAEAIRYLLVDRWFPDIMAFTRQSMCGPRDEVSVRQIRRLCQDRCAQVMAALKGRYTLRQLAVFIPIVSCSFATAGQEGKFRATTNRNEWETICLEEWPSVVDRLPGLTLASSDLTTRIFDVKMALSTLRKPHVKPESSRKP